MKWIKSLLLFFQAFFKNPRATGAIFPSSHYLAHSMAACIDASKNDLILELGPGTGVITEAILKSGIAPTQLILLEVVDQFAKKLRKRFPEMTVITGNATQLSRLLKDKGDVQTIISSLPLRSLPKEECQAIFSEIQKVLSPTGQFIQFTYAVKNGEHFYPDNFILTRSFIEWRNIPPAKVTVFRIE